MQDQHLIRNFSGIRQIYETPLAFPQYLQQYPKRKEADGL